ncbi:unnamed protein product [Hydatigera taeniaeformis]|uniref:ArgoN domain-containing protein n=1 Tax=Hydatigena taeniaeformis TaxID=6205 RepID=A0A0R3X7Q3_HYDTA|nr:unnamed protein product [Hydatigera taeniaeformis]
MSHLTAEIDKSCDRYPRGMRHISQRDDGCRGTGGSSLKNTELRFNILKSAVPGPGAHDIKSNLSGSEYDPCDLLMPYLIYVKKPKIPIRYVDRTFPSIIATLDAHGYEMGQNGQLEPRRVQAQFCTDESVGSKHEACQRYRGCKWGSRTDYRRTFSPPNDYPGPGTYFTSLNDEWVQLIIRGLQRNLINSKHVLKIPRYIEKHVLDAKQENLPPPGLYFAEENVPKTPNPHRPPFASSASRFPPHDSSVPGPGTYNTNRDKFDSFCTLRNQKKIPFLSSDARMTKTDTNLIPGKSLLVVF